MIASMRVFLFSLIALLPAALAAGEITAHRSDRGVTIKIDGSLFAEYLTRSGSKPAVWPIIGPSGAAMTRAWPVQAANGGSKDHVHHRSLWFTHGQVNGVDFWDETKHGGGRVQHSGYVSITSGPQAVVATRNDWLGPDGKKICEDQRRLTFGRGKASRWIDFDIVIKASEGPVTFGDTKEGTFGLRVADSITVDAQRGGHIVNSRGQTNAAAWSQSAEWVDYYGPVDGQTVGIAVLNHPNSLRFPTRWHVRTYGLFAANPFAQRAFNGDGKQDGSYTIPAGDTIKLAYRIVLHRGDEREGQIAAAFADYASEKK
jgi:hypothetical protein